MSVEALWSVEFMSNVGGVGAGVAIFENGNIYGGDGTYYYTGKYRIVNSQVDATVKVAHYAGQPLSIFGQDTRPFDLRIGGPVSDSVMNLAGVRIDDESKRMGLRLTKRTELP
ncbi:MAG: hypothetical protein LDL19_05810 [Thiobacillus sp.]|nr:hypothetical protein [Thiobacillus sp.]